MKLAYDANASCYCDLNNAVFGDMEIVLTFGNRLAGIVAVGTNPEGVEEIVIDAIDDDGNPYSWGREKPAGQISSLADWARTMLHGTMFAADLLQIGFTLNV